MIRKYILEKEWFITTLELSGVIRQVIEGKVTLAEKEILNPDSYYFIDHTNATRVQLDEDLYSKEDSSFLFATQTEAQDFIDAENAETIGTPQIK